MALDTASSISNESLNRVKESLINSIDGAKEIIKKREDKE
jgi:hypothetical protein